MKKVLFWLFCFSFSVSLTAQNMVPNPGLEEGTDLPEPWIIHHMIKGTWAEHSKAEWATDEVHSGKRSIKLSVTKSAGRTLGWRLSEETPVPVKGSLKVRVSGWMKTKDIVMGPTDYNVPSIVFVTYDVNKNRLKQYWIARATSENTGWTKYEDVIHLQDEVEYFTLSAGLSNCTGTAWFDDFEVVYEDAVSFLDALAPVLAGRDKKEKPVIIPQPCKENYGDETFFLSTPALVLDSPETNQQAQKELQSFFKDAFQHEMPVFSSGSELPDYETVLLLGKPEPGSMVKRYLQQLDITVDWEEMGPQGYVLAIKKLGNKKLLLLSGNTEQGIYYAAQTLKQYPIKKEGGHIMREGIILDKPSYSWRGIVPGGTSMNRIDTWMVPLKVNVIYGVPGTGSYEWWHAFSPEYKKTLKEWVEECRRRFITPVAGTRPDRGYVRRIKFSSREDVTAILQTYRNYYDCGIRFFKIAFDDGHPYLEYAEDKAKFKNIAEAHYYLAYEVYKLLKTLDDGNELSVCPLHYYNPLEWSPQQKEYIAILSRLPEDISFINCSTMTKESALEHVRLTGRKPLNWDNWVARFETMKPLPTLVPPPFTGNDREIVNYSQGYMFPLLDRKVFWYSASDYMWNASRHTPEKASVRIMEKMFGYESLVKLSEYQKFLHANYSLPIPGFTAEEKKQAARNLVKNFTDYADTLKGAIPEDLEQEIESTVSNRVELLEKVYLKQLEKKPLPVEIPFTSTPPKIDGRLQDEAWKKSVRLTGFSTPISRKTGVSPGTEQTEVLMLYDKENLYISFICKEPSMENLRAKMTDADSEVFLDDCVEMMFAAGAENKDYYHIVVNSIGTVYDAFVSDKTWNSGAVVKTFRQDNQWKVEMAIPFKKSGIKADRGDKWHFNLFRERYAGEKPEVTSWAIVENRFHEPERFWILKFK